jgi:hypothetical protein
MTPATKYNALLTGVTVFLMYWLVAYATPFLNGLQWHQAAMFSVAALLSSAGSFRLLSLGLNWLMSKSHRVRKLVLGPYYMHGTWVGWFIGHAGDKRYMVEHFAQDLEQLWITGRSFTDQLNPHGQWTSQAVTVDVEHGQLVFTYFFDVITNSATLAGVHTSTLDRKSQHDAPTALGGFAHDMNDITRIAVHSEKISDDLLSFSDTAKIAKQMYP